MNGVLVVNKPQGMTSHDVVRRVRHLAQQRDVGHLGTLDPMATGVLPLVLGRMTRIAQFYDHADKAYEGVIRFGWATNTYDADGKPITDPSEVRFSPEELEAAMNEFRGEIEQVPPPFSAKKVDGVPAYKLARKEQSVPLKAVHVTVRRFEVVSLALPVDGSSDSRSGTMAFKSEVTAGTYIRSLAHDLGKRVGTGAHLLSLCRSRSAEFTLDKSWPLADLEVKTAAGELQSCLVPARALLPAMPGVKATEDQMAKIRHGNAVNLSEFSQAELVKVFFGGELVAIARRVAGTLFQPKIVLLGSTG